MQPRTHEHLQASITWVPVVLGGLYELSKAPQGKDGSSNDVVPQARKRFVSRALHRDLQRYHLSLTYPRNHPLKTVDGKRKPPNKIETFVQNHFRLTNYYFCTLLCARVCACMLLDFV
jgi:hypothetical protein